MNAVGEGLSLVMLSGDFSLPPYGGIATHLSGLAAALTARGHRVRVVVPEYGRGEVSERADGYEVIRVGRCPGPRYLRYPCRMWGVRRYLGDLLARSDADLLHVHDFLDGPPIAKAFASRWPVVFTNHTSDFLDLAASWYGRWMLRRMIGRPHAVISVSPELERASRLLRPARSELIPSAVDAERFQPSVEPVPLRDRLAIDAAAPIVLFVGRIHRVKGLDVLVAAFADVRRKVPDARLVIVGAGDPAEMAALRGDAVDLVGRVPNDELPGYYRAADLVCLPSLMEATSLSGLEAMASGLPLVATDVGGLPLIVENEVTGLLVPAQRPDALSRALVTLLRDPARRAAMGEAGRRRAIERFSWEGVAARTETFYRETIDSFGRR